LGRGSALDQKFEVGSIGRVRREKREQHTEGDAIGSVRGLVGVCVGGEKGL
jgi:hypothetical protein